MFQAKWDICARFVLCRLFVAAFLLTEIAFVPATLLRAQSGFEAQIRGRVTDPSGAAVLGVNYGPRC